ncbi:MAG: RNA methyltransferase [Magnetococcales bacterium]|nr:RNA methyltransferase [Magnetococcales bacterium]
MTGLSQQLVVILDRPAHAGNIGAVARAMGNMGLLRLRLVNPRQFPHEDARQFAASHGAILDQTEIFPDLGSALADLHFLVATSNRPRGQRHTVLTPRQLAAQLPAVLAHPGTTVGLLFGTERTGLETSDLERAHWICNIPTHLGNGSLNLAQAVLLVAYELMLGNEQGDSFAFDPSHDGVRASVADLDRFFEHLRTTLLTIGFLRDEQNRHIMGSIKALFLRAVPDRREIAILRGMLNEMLAFRRQHIASLDLAAHDRLLTEAREPGILSSHR